MMEMIEGIKVQVPGADLAIHMASRAAHHHEKAEWYAKRVADLAPVVPAEGVTNNPTAALQSSQRTHENKAAFFALLAKYIVRDARYVLSESDLTRIEFYEHFY